MYVRCLGKLPGKRRARTEKAVPILRFGKATYKALEVLKHVVNAARQLALKPTPGQMRFLTALEHSDNLARPVTIAHPRTPDLRQGSLEAMPLIPPLNSR